MSMGRAGVRGAVAKGTNLALSGFSASINEPEEACVTRLKSALAKGTLIAAAAGLLAATSTPASADVACNRWGECWHVHDRYANYPANLGIVFHEDGWRGDHGRRWRWRHDMADDHGYYRHGGWHRF